MRFNKYLFSRDSVNSALTVLSINEWNSFWNFVVAAARCSAECEHLQHTVGRVTSADDDVILTSQTAGVDSLLHCSTQSDWVTAAEQLLRGHYCCCCYCYCCKGSPMCNKMK